jgi:hypothetical protein
MSDAPKKKSAANPRKKKTSSSDKPRVSDVAETQEKLRVAAQKPTAASEGVPPQTTPPAAPVLNEQLANQLRWGAIGVWLLTAILAGVLFGPPQVVLVLAAGALATVIWLFWSSLRTLLGETRLSGADAYAMGAVRAEEEQKRAVLRALKDLEFERSVGKISEDDYKRLAQEYRFEAKRLLRQIDEDSQSIRERAQQLVDQHLEKAGLGKKPEARTPEDIELAAMIGDAPVDDLGDHAQKAESNDANAEPSATAETDAASSEDVKEADRKEDADASADEKKAEKSAQGVGDV